VAVAETVMNAIVRAADTNRTVLIEG